MYPLTHLFAQGQINQSLTEMVCKSIYYSTGLPASVLNPKGKRLYSLGTDSHVEHLFPKAMDGLLPYVRNQFSLNGNGIYIYDTPYEFSFVVMVLSEQSQFKGMLLFGPYSVKSIDEHLINEILNANKFSLAHREPIKNFYDGIAVMSASRNYYIQQLILSTVTNTQLNDVIDSSDLDIDGPQPVAPQIEVERQEHNYALEILFMTKVKNGDIEKVVDLFNEHIKTQYLNNHSSEPLRTAKNRAFSLSTLLARAIIEGGTEAEKALSLEGYFREHIESTRNLKDLVNLLEQMVIRYTNMILQVSNINHVSVIKNASKFVHMHLSEPIRLNDVANYVNLSPNYFSSLFKREMNLSFADYVNQTRIKESQYLLETTDHSILDIALSVGYNNQNYFTTIFRKFTGITPKQYRMRSTK